QPIASTCSLRRTGVNNSASAVPRVQPFQMVYFSVCTFSSPMDFIFPAPHSSALRSPGEPVTRAPTSSLSSVKNSNACAFISPSPAIFTSAGMVPPSLGPFPASLSARTPPAQPNIPATTVTANILLIPPPYAPQLISSTRLHSCSYTLPLLYSFTVPLSQTR